MHAVDEEPRSSARAGIQQDAFLSEMTSASKSAVSTSLCSSPDLYLAIAVW